MKVEPPPPFALSRKKTPFKRKFCLADLYSQRVQYSHVALLNTEQDQLQVLNLLFGHLHRLTEILDGWRL